MKEEKIKDILRSIQTINTLADLIIIEYHHDLADKPFKLPVLNQKAKRIKQDAEDIKKQLNTLAKIKDLEESENHGYQMYRLIKMFSTMDINQLEGFLDKAELLPTIEINDTIEILDN